MPGLMRGMARTAVVAGTASAVSGNVHRRQQKKWSAEENAQMQAQAQAMSQAAPAPAQDDTVAQLEQLAQLKNQGIITEDEFTAKKAQILGL